MDLEVDFPFDGLPGLDDLIGQDTFDSLPFLGLSSDLETPQAELEADQMEGIQAQDLSSLLEQFEEASQSLDGVDFPKADAPLPKSKSLPASRVCSAASSPVNTPPATPPPCVLDKIRARQGQTAKRKSAIMLPMGAPTKRGRGKAAAQEITAAASGSSKLQRILSRNSQCASPSPVIPLSLSQTVEKAAKQVSAGVPASSPVMKPVNACTFQSGVQSAVSYAPSTVFSSQPPVLGKTVAQPVPLIFTPLGTVSGQKSIPVQFVMANTRPAGGSILLKQQLLSTPEVVFCSAATSSTNHSNTVGSSVSPKPVAVRPPPLEIKKVRQKRYTTVSTRAEGISHLVLDSIMDHDYCANSPRRVIVDEFDLDLSPTKPVHKVKSLPTINSEMGQFSRNDLTSTKHLHAALTQKPSEIKQTSTTVSPVVSLLAKGELISQQHQSDLSGGDSSAAERLVAPSALHQLHSHSALPAPSQNSKPVPEVILMNNRSVTCSLPEKVGQVTPGVSLLKEGGAPSGSCQAFPLPAQKTDTCTEENRAELCTPECVRNSMTDADPSGISSDQCSNISTSNLNICEGTSALTDTQEETETEKPEEKEIQDGVLQKTEPAVLFSMPVFDDEEIPSVDPSERIVTPVESTTNNESSINLEGIESAEPSSSESIIDCEKAEMPQEVTSIPEEYSDNAVVPRSPEHFDDLPALATDPFKISQEAEEFEMYTEEELAQADRERFICFEEEEEEKMVSSSRGRGRGRGRKKSRQIGKWRPGGSPVKEDHSGFFNKIPSYYTALSTPTKTGRKQLTADGLEGMSISTVTDFIPQDHSPPRDDASSTYSKLPAYHSCFTNSTKYDEAAGDDNSCQGNSNDGSKSVELMGGTSDESRCSRSKSRSRSSSRSRSRSRSTSQGRSRKRVRSTSSSDSSHSRSRSQPRHKRSRRSGSSTSESSCSSSVSRSGSSSRSHSCSPTRPGDKRTPTAGEDRSFKKRQKQKDKIRKMEERKIVYVGRIPDGYTRKELRRRFEGFGQIEEVSVHFREAGDNYGFVTFYYTCDAYAAIDKGNNDPSELKFDLCFGGRRHFCANDYADLDGNLVIEEEYTPMPAKDPVGFDELLRQAKQKLKRKW